MSDETNELTQTSEQTLLEAVLEMSAKLGVIEQKMNAIPHERHNEEHEYLKSEIERRKAQRDFWRDINKKLATTTIIGAFSLLGLALLYAFTQWVKNLGH